jgi:serine protease Do
MRSRGLFVLPMAAFVLMPVAATAQAAVPPAGSQQPAAQATPDTAAALALSAAFRAAAERTLPAVVYIDVEQAATIARREQMEIPEELRRLLPPGWAPREMPGDPRAQPRRGTGSGFIIDTQGHILTNTHVVADASRLTVRLQDGREYAARVVGTDISTDIAVIRIDPRPGELLPTAPLGNSDVLRVGDWVLALGSPLGLDFTVTAGIVSAMGRSTRGGMSAGLESFIQTDAVINPGNSGGPLIDLFGRVVGVNSAIFGSDRFVGYGFAVPISLANRVSADLLEHGYLRRPMLGASISSANATDAEIYGLPEVRGVLISGVTPDGPAAAAGIRPGDVVLSLDGQPIRDDTHLLTSLAGRRPGERVNIGIRRDRRDVTIPVELSEFPRPPEPAAATAPMRDAPIEVLGFAVRDLTPRDAQGAGYTGEGGVIVDNVTDRNVPVGPGTIILAINGQRVRNAEHARQLTREVRPGSAVSLRIHHREYGEIVQNYRTRP